MITELKIENPGLIRFKSTKYGTPTNTSARFDLFLIDEAWHRGCSFEAEADGFGAGMGTQGDWSAIRDSSEEAIAKMLEKAINFLFPDKKRG